MASNNAEVAWPNLVLLAAALAAAIFILPLVIAFPLLDPDEGLHASIAQEMVERGSWITPTFLGERFLDKPIVYFWTQAASLWLFGPNEAAVRLPGLLFGLLGAATTGLLGWRMFGRTTGLVATILYTTTILPAAMAQAASHDVALIPWINLAMLLLWECDRAVTRRANVACAAAAGALLGLSILTKGLLGVGVVGLAFGSYILIARRLSLEIVLRGLAVVVIAVVVASPWYVLVEMQNPGYLHYFFLDRHLLGLMTATQPHSNQPWWYYIPILIGGGLPWIGYLPILVQDVRAEGGDRPADRAAMLLLWCWLIGWTLFLTLARSKLATYLWPVFPPMAILAGVVWTRLIDGTLSEAARKSVARAFVWGSWTGPVVLPAAMLAVHVAFGAHFAWPVWAAVGVVTIASPLPVMAWYAGRWQACLAAASLSLAVQFVVVMTVVIPPVADVFSARDLAQRFNRLGEVPPRLFVAEERIGSLVFYLDPQLRVGLKQGQLQSLFADQVPQFQVGDMVALPNRKLSQIREYLDLAENPYSEVGHYRLYRITLPPGKD
jgi:4-amino-4-deoxy-L-arabinose transferase-like glycosyltransferase